MDIIAAKLGANMAINSLENSGQIGSIAVNKEIIFPFMALEFEVLDEETGISGVSIHASTELLEAAVDNKSLTFTFDGTNYLCPANYLEGMGVLWGNGSFFGMEDTGEPFAFGVDVNKLQTSFLCITGGIHTAEISLVSETIKPIEPKFLANEVDLTKFNVEYSGQSMTLNDLVQYLVNASATSGGTMQHTGYISAAGVREALSTTQQIVMAITTPMGSVARFPMMVSLLDGVAINVSGTAFIYSNGVPIESTTMFVFYNDPTRTEIDMYVLAKILA